MQTPWGKADHVELVGDTGMKWVSTPSHGGLYIPGAFLQKLPVELRASNSYSGCGCWFEEDVEWAIPVLAFPQYFPPATCAAAVLTIESYSQAERGKYMYSAAQWLKSDPDAVPVKERAKLAA